MKKGRKRGKRKSGKKKKKRERGMEGKKKRGKKERKGKGRKKEKEKKNDSLRSVWITEGEHPSSVGFAATFPQGGRQERCRVRNSS